MEEAILKIVRARVTNGKDFTSLNDLLVMKFGGTSVGSAERMRACARIAADASRRPRPVAIVVSAMSKITDLLLDTMRHAEAGDRAGMEANLANLRRRHEEACRELLPAARTSRCWRKWTSLIAEFERIVNGMADAERTAAALGG